MMNQSQTKSVKRFDLQGIRGLAIIAVLCFHFFSEYCPNGYLGVDQFFVLSGFLMCMLLNRADGKSPFSLLFTFYSKRLKRILPLYLFIILLSMGFLYYFFPDTAIEINQNSAMRALLFVSNRESTVEEDYFQMLDMALDIFTHTWSLSVEVQFYLLVPFIFILARKFSDGAQLYYYGVLGMIVYIIGMSEQEKRYKLIRDVEEGEWESKEALLKNEESQENVIKYQDEDAKKPVITLGTGFLILISQENRFLSNTVLVYIGDISYSLYLIHWPLYAYWKLTNDGNSILLLFFLVASIILAAVTFETFEKWYLAQSFTTIGVLVYVLFAFNVFAIRKDDVSEYLYSIRRNYSTSDFVTDNMTLDDAARMNYKWSVNDNRNLNCATCLYGNVDNHLGWCRHINLKRTGKYKMAIIGNSWTANHATLFYQECADKANSILQGAASGCEPLYPSRFSETCKANFTDFEKRIQLEKPDYVFILTRYISIGAPFPKGVKSFDDDPVYQTMKKQMLKFISHIKYKLFILDAIPRLHRNVVSQIVPLMKKQTDPTVIDEMLVNFDDYEMARKRHAQLVKDCNGKCVIVDYATEFFNTTTGKFRFFDDKGFSYFTTPMHLSPHGIEHVRHVWTNICAKL